MLKLLILLLVYTVGVQSECEESDQIQCRTNDRCTRIQYVCDGENDCGDNSDENSDLCNLWRNSDCSRAEAVCRRGDARSCVNLRDYCRRNVDTPCEGNVDMRLCQMVNERKLQLLEDVVLAPELGVFDSETDFERTLDKGEDFLETSKHTLSSDKCPPLYTRIGEECISVFFFANLTWGEARSFCKNIGGDLFIPKENEEFHILVRHLKKYNITADFWVGGNYKNESIGWRWINDKPIELDIPHWALRHDSDCHAREISHENRNETEQANHGHCYNYSLAPAAKPRGRCVASTYEKFFFLSDENCLKLKSPLCKIYDVTTDPA